MAAALRPSWPDLAALGRRAVAAWVDDYAPSMGAALAFYTLFSLAPLLLICLSIAGMALGEEAARGELFGELTAMLGPAGASAVESLLASAREPGGGIVATIVGAVMLVVGATAVFGELSDALDRIWRAPPDARRRRSGLVGMLRGRLLSFGMVVALGFLLVVSLAASAAVAALTRRWSPDVAGWQPFAWMLDATLGLLLVTVLFALVYKTLPSVRVAWRDVWTGAVVTAVLFTAGKAAIGWYIGTSGVASGFGAAGSLIAVLVWVYWSAQVFLLGAEFTWLYATTFGSRRARCRGPENARPASPMARPTP
jgi:membrane protein